MARAVLDVTALGGSPQLAERVIQLAPATLGELGPGYPVVPRPRNSVAHAYLSGWTTADGTPRTPANAQALVWLSDNSLGLPNTTAAIVGGLNSVLMFQDGAGGWFYDLPASLFTAGFDYTLTIQGQDLAGNPLDTWYFRLVEQAS